HAAAPSLHDALPISETVPEDARFGVYSYAAAGAVNPAEEIFVPVRFNPEPGPNTPTAPPQDLVWGFAPGFDDMVTGSLQGAAAGDRKSTRLNSSHVS